MVKQKLISFKIDTDLLEQLDSFCQLNESKRNRALNNFVRIGLSNLSHYILCRLVVEHCEECGINWHSLLNSKGSFDF